MKNYYHSVGKFTAKPGKRDKLRNLLLQAAELMGNNADCLKYIVSTSGDPNAVWVTEVWTDKAAHDASLAPAEVRALIQKVMPLVASMDLVAELHTEGGKGLK